MSEDEKKSSEGKTEESCGPCCAECGCGCNDTLSDSRTGQPEDEEKKDK